MKIARVACRLGAFVTATLLAAGVAYAADPTTGRDPRPYRDWDLALYPYLWAASVEGHAQGSFAGQDFDIHVDESFKDILPDLDLGAMGVLEGRYKRAVALVDGFYIKVSDESNVLVNSRLDADLSIAIADAKAGFRVLDMNAPWGLENSRSPHLIVDLLAGARYWWTGFDAHLKTPGPNRNFSPSNDWADPILGARIGVGITETLNVSLIGDAGGFDINGIDSSELTWMVLPSLNWRPWDRWSFHVGYKHLDAERSHDLDFSLSGPVLGVGFHF